MSTGDIQRVIFILIDGDLEDDVLRFRAVAFVPVRFDDDDPMQISVSMAFGGRNAVSKLGLDKHKSIQLSKHGPSNTVLDTN